MNPVPSRDEMLELVAAHALGVLPASDAAHVSAFILADADARREYDELRSVASLIGVSAEEPVDSGRALRMKERLMARVRSEAPQPRSGPNPRRASAFWAASLAAAAAIVFALVSVIQNLGLRSDLAETQRRATVLQTQIAEEHRRVARDGRILADLTAGDAKRYDVKYGTVVARGSHLYMTFSALPPLPRGKVYQAWTFPRGTTAPQPSVTFTPSESGLTLVPIPVDAARLGAVALTVEPEGGSKAPTTKPAFVLPLS